TPTLHASRRFIQTAESPVHRQPPTQPRELIRSLNSLPVDCISMARSTEYTRLIITHARTIIQTTSKHEVLLIVAYLAGRLSTRCYRHQTASGPYHRKMRVKSS